MKVINWLNLDLDKTSLSHVSDSLEKVVHLRTFLKQLVHFLLSKYPWDQRTDTVSIFNPSLKYQQDHIVALPVSDPQGLRPNTWRLGHVVDITGGENSIQGVFQVVTIEIENRQKQLAANIEGAQPLEFELSLDDSDDIEWLVGDIVDTYYTQFYQAIVRAISQGNLNASIQGENLILGQLTETLGEVEIEYLQELIGKEQIDELWIDSVDLLAKIRGLGGLEDFIDDLAIHLIEAYLESQGFYLVGQNRWSLPEKIEEIDRTIQVRPKVPVVQSKVIKELGHQEVEKFSEYEEIALEDEGQAALETFGEDGDFEVIFGEDWTPPTTPVQLPTITYQNIIEAFFPLSAMLSKAFPARADVFLVDFQIAQGDHLPFIINREQRLIKAIDPDHSRQRMLEESITAGTKLWLEYQHGLTYRIFPKPLTQPVNRICKIANWDDAGNLSFTIQEIPINYEHEAQIFVAEFRHSDPVALFKEAELSGLSIFDALYYSIQELAELNSNGQVHYFELFHAVFFRHRMCSPRSVITELYSRPCFVATGDGYFYLDVEKGFRRSGITKKSRSKPQAPKQKRIDTPASGYFIFQQNPKGVSEYQDEPGKIYNWRQGIPGSNQINANSRFIYYRPGEKVFFGSGLIQKIETYVADDGTEYHDGIITDYEPWDPPLVFTEELSEKLSFHNPRRIWIGQMGIRKIIQADYDIISDAHYSLRKKSVKYHKEYGQQSKVSVDELFDEVDQYGDQARRNLLKKLQESFIIQKLEIARSKSIYDIGSAIIWIRYSKTYPNNRGYFFDLNETEFSTIKAIGKRIFVLFICGSSERVAVIPVENLETYGLRSSKKNVRGRWLQMIFPTPPLLEIYLWKESSDEVRHDITWTLNNYRLLGIDDDQKSIQSVDITETLKSLIGKKLYTLDQKKPFEVINSDYETTIIRTSTGVEREIAITSIHAAWEDLENSGKLSRTRIQGQYSNFSPAYIAAILATFPGVHHSTEPIILFYRREGNDEKSLVDNSVTNVISSIDLELAYLFGLTVVRGIFTDYGLKISLQASQLESDVSNQDSSAISESIEILKKRLVRRFDNQLSMNFSTMHTEIIIPVGTKIFEHLSLLKGNNGSMTIPDFIYELSYDIKVEFARGIADAAGFVRRAQYYTDGRIFIFFQIRQSDWLLPTKICKLFQSYLDVPVSFIIWGHPNIRDPKAKSSRASWAKEHQLKVFCDAFDHIGFNLPYKQNAFKFLVEINKKLGKPTPKHCDPRNKRLGQSKPSHPDENSDKLPPELRGIHCDTWWEVCLSMNCPFASQVSIQQKLFV